MAFDELVNSLNVFTPSTDVDLAPSYPGAKNSATAKNINNFDYGVKYGQFFITPEGNKELELIMESCIKGEKILCWEKFSSTKEGRTFITVKYMVPIARSPILGKRRQRKASLNKTS